MSSGIAFLVSSHTLFQILLLAREGSKQTQNSSHPSKVTAPAHHRWQARKERDTLSPPPNTFLSLMAVNTAVTVMTPGVSCLPCCVTHVPTYTHACGAVCAHMSMHASIHMPVYLSSKRSDRGCGEHPGLRAARIFIHMHVYAHIYTHVCTHFCMHVYTHTYTHVLCACL